MNPRFVVPQDLVQQVKDHIIQNKLCEKKIKKNYISEASHKEQSQQNKEIPTGFICFITGKIMKNPVFLTSGHSYEKEALDKHI